MLTQMSLILLSCFFCMNGLYAEEDTTNTFLEKEIEDLSFYMGYLIGRDHLKNSYGFPSKFDKLVEGIRAGIAKEPIPQNEEIISLIKRMQKTIVEKQTELNLQEAENYLEEIVKTQLDLIEIEPFKLYYSIAKVGEGLVIENHPWLHFKMSELKNGELHLLYSTYDDRGEPLQVDLEAVIPGFSRGLHGMRIDEQRLIYVHPDLAFGLGKHEIAPNRMLVFDVIAFREKL